MHTVKSRRFDQGLLCETNKKLFSVQLKEVSN